MTVLIDFDSPEHARAFASGEARAAALEEAGVRHRDDELLDVVSTAGGREHDPGPDGE